MANDFDRFPLDDQVIKSGTLYLSAVWVTSMATFWQNLVEYLSSMGFFLPNLTQAQIDTIQAPVNGQTLYNTTVDAPQFYQISSKSWRTFSFT